MRHDPPQFYLIDGYALIYRAFYALIARPLRTTKGENTSAALGVVNFLLKLREKYQPDYLAWIHDAGDSFRTALYSEYKSTREKLDSELQADFDRSVERIKQLLAAFRIPLVTLNGYEADDVIGSLAVKGVERGWQVVIVSGDKDFYQLIGPGVALLNPGRGGSAGVEEHWVDESNAAERLGVGPAQVADYLALVGDSSDNVPGVKGIGGKGAVELLQQFGDLESLLGRAEEVKNKRAREALIAYADSARLSRELVTIKRDVAVTLDPAAFEECEPDVPALLKIFSELEFYSLVQKYEVMAPPVGQGAGTATEAPAAQGAPARVVADPSELPEIVARLRAAPLVALSARTSGGDPRDSTLIGLSLAAGPSEHWYLSFGHRPEDGELAAPAAVPNLPPLDSPTLASVAAVLADPLVPKAGHNIKYDWQVLRRAGVELAGVTFDSMLASFVLDPGRRTHAIDNLSFEHLSRQLPQLEASARGRPPRPVAELSQAVVANVSCAQCLAVLGLHAWFTPQLDQLKLTSLLTEIELPLVPVLADMEWTGIAIDRELFRRLSSELTQELAALERDIAQQSASDLNLNSPKQLAVLLFDKLQLPILKKTKTGPSTDADVLEQLAGLGHEVPRLILEYRELQKLKSTYVDVLPERVNRVTGRIHTSFNQTGAATGRLSSSDPNLQNIPVRTARGEVIRRGFVPGPGRMLVVADYSQIELRLLADLSEDPVLIQAFQDGGDIHRQTASLLFGVPVDQVTSEMRARAKTINFGTIYGQGAFALSRMLGISLEEAKAFIAQYFERFAGVRVYLDRQVRIARDTGYVETKFGRRRYITEIHDKNFNLRAFAERTAQNTPLQGSAADLIKVAMVRIHGALQAEHPGAKLLLQVHDELVAEASIAEAEAVKDLMRRHMEGAAELKVPLVVDVGIGGNWLDAKK